MVNTNTDEKKGPTAAAANGRNGKHASPRSGERGSVVMVCVDLGLAEAMRRVIFPAACWTDDAGSLKEFADNRQVVVVHCGREGATVAQTAATHFQARCHPERVGIIDLADALGFAGPADAFVDWYEDRSGMGQFEDGVDFVRQVADRAEWRRFTATLLDDDDEPGSDVKDPIGRVDPRAFHGILGRLALETQPETEADPLAVLIHLLVFFGASIGRGPHFVISGTRHRLNLFEALVGVTGSSRKGTAGDVARTTWSMIDPDFERENIIDGLNSGAGLLINIRDASVRRDKNGKPIADEGVTDKRRAFLEDELGTVLKSGHRENESLLDLLRKFWDGREVVRSNTRDPTRVTEGHVAVVGHCTPDELKFNLSELDKQNGTANRFEYLLCRRSKFLPKGGDVFDLLSNFLSAELQELREALEFGRAAGQIRRDPSIEPRWEQLYASLNTIPPGRIGAFYVRAPVIVMRRAALFALADRSVLIRECHLDASLAIWEHSVRTLRFIFPEDVDPLAEKLLAALDVNPEGLTKREILAVFNNHLKAQALDPLLERLFSL
jgi:hypothetical protein